MRTTRVGRRRLRRVKTVRATAFHGFKVVLLQCVMCSYVFSSKSCRFGSRNGRVNIVSGARDRSRCLVSKPCYSRTVGLLSFNLSGKALGYLLDNISYKKKFRQHFPFWQNEFRRQMPNFRVHGHNYLLYLRTDVDICMMLK